MSSPFFYGGFNFTWSNSGTLQYQFGNDKYAVGTLPVPVTQASIDAQKGNGAAQNNPAFLAALNNLDVDGLNAAIANAQRPIANEAPASSGEIAANQQAAKDDGALDQDPTQPRTVLTLDGRILPAGQATTPPAQSIELGQNAPSTTVVNGQIVPINQEVGTNDPLKSISQTQATPPYDPNINAGSNGVLGSGTFGILDQNGNPVNTAAETGTFGLLNQAGSQASAAGIQGQLYAAGQLPGAGSGTGINNPLRQADDNPAGSNGNPITNTQQVLTQTFTGVIPTQQNQLDQYASYTYALSWYLLTPQQYTEFQNGVKNSSQWSLLMQSGGAATSPTVGQDLYADNPAASAATALAGGRSQFFPYDYYMDDLEITTLIPLGGTGLCHSATDIRFKVVEPNGISLINNLYKAVSTLYKQPQPVATGPTNTTNATIAIQNPNYPMAHYCMIIHFYGYDQQGNLVAPAVGSYSPNGVPSKNDPRAVIEKYYPFVIANLKYRMANKQIEYEILGKPQAHFYNIGTDRGSIPFNFNIVGSTVGQMLVGTPVTTQTNTADPGARVAKPNPTNITGTSPAAASVNNVLKDLTLAVTNGVDTSTGINFNF